MQTAATESTWPVMGAIKWTRTYHAMLATPLTERDVLDRPPALRGDAGAHVASAAYLAGRRAFGAVDSWLGLLAIPAAVLIGPAFAMPIAASRPRVEHDRSFLAVFRFVIMPMFLFSGTFFPVRQLPLVLELARLRHAAVARRRALPRR